MQSVEALLGGICLTGLRVMRAAGFHQDSMDSSIALTRGVTLTLGFKQEAVRVTWLLAKDNVR